MTPTYECYCHLFIVRLFYFFAVFKRKLVGLAFWEPDSMISMLPFTNLFHSYSKSAMFDQVSLIWPPLCSLIYMKLNYKPQLSMQRTKQDAVFLVEIHVWSEYETNYM